MADDGHEQAPGARHLVRIFLETLRAHGEALGAGDHLARDLTPSKWTGAARDRYVTRGLERLDRDWSATAAVNRSVSGTFEGYNAFVHALHELWTKSANDPVERDRLRGLWETRAQGMAGEVLAKAAELDAIGRRESTHPAEEPPPSAVPNGSATRNMGRSSGKASEDPAAVSPANGEHGHHGAGEGAEPGSEPDSGEGVDDSGEQGTSQPVEQPSEEAASLDGSPPTSPDDNQAGQPHGGSDGGSADGQSSGHLGATHRLPLTPQAERLRDQVLGGERRDYIPWTG